LFTFCIIFYTTVYGLDAATELYTHRSLLDQIPCWIRTAISKSRWACYVLTYLAF